MAKRRLPTDCKRLRPEHVSRLDSTELVALAERIELQTQALGRARRLVDDALARLDE